MQIYGALMAESVIKLCTTGVPKGIDRNRLKHALTTTKTVDVYDEKRVSGKLECLVEIVLLDTLSCAFMLSKLGKNPLVLDFASDSVPGGGWRSKQQGTQEESICRQSSLGLSLESAKYPFSDRSGIYVPDVLVFQPEPYWVSVIASSMRFGGDGEKEDIRIEAKWRGIVNLAIKHKHDVLVLGAWGCGAFGCDPEKIAKAAKRALIGYKGTVYFAVPKLYEVFKKVFTDT